MSPPFDGTSARDETLGVAAAKESKPLRLGRTADEVYATVWRIARIQEFFDKEQAKWDRQLALQPTHEYAAFWRSSLEKHWALRRVFEAQLVKDPAKAIADFDLARLSYLDGRGLSEGKDAITWALLGRAVEHVFIWLRMQDGKDRHPDDPRYHAMPMPVATIGYVAWARPVSSVADLEALARAGSVRKARKGDGAKKRGGHKAAAIALVALASGIGEQTVKRAAAAYVRGSKDDGD